MDTGILLRDGVQTASIGPTAAPHSRPVSEVARALETDPTRGLAATEAAVRLERSGPNRITVPERIPYLRIAVRQFLDPLVGLLVAAAVVSAGLGEGIEAAAIGLIVLLNALLGFVQEAGAERAVVALREGVEQGATVVRDGVPLQVAAPEVVVGDLLAIRDGDRVAADARLVDAVGLEVDESILTGESIPAAKAIEPVEDDAPLGDRISMVFAGSGVTRGRGRAIVTSTGSATEAGRIADLTAAVRRPPTPLQRRLGALARVLVVAGTAVTVVLAAAMVLRGESLHEAFLVSVAVAVAAVPEGLAATVTIALALGAGSMAARGAIVRRLAAVETAGQATVICTDKTGTLTENRLHVAAVAPAAGVGAAEVLAAAVLASSIELPEDGSGGAVAGDPVEAALVRAAAERGVGRDELGRYELLLELPFDSDRKRMTRLLRSPRGPTAFMKGAPEIVAERTVLDGAAHMRIERAARAWAEEGLRVLAVAARPVPDGLDADPETLERDLDYMGLIALHDPLRPSARGAVRAARQAGLRVLMLTGDHPATAATIARTLDLQPEDVFARITPAEKLEIVERLQEDGEVVAVTGDGVNDAPALRRADLGVAMGRGGTEAARDASDVVLTDDDFATIVAAIHEGRRIAANVRTFVAFLLSANFGEVILFAAAIIGGLGVPMTVVQVLVVNLLTDGLPAVALTRDAARPDAGHRPPRDGARLFTRTLTAVLLGAGLLVGLAALGTFLVARSVAPDAAQTMTFATVALAELVVVFSFRSEQPAWRVPRNGYLLAAVASSLVLLGLAIWTPRVDDLVGAVPLGVTEVAIVAGFSLLPFIAAETAKWLVARRSRPVRRSP